MNELAYHCTIYINAESNETMEEAADRLERILSGVGIVANFYDMELRDPDGNVLEKK